MRVASACAAVGRSSRKATTARWGFMLFQYRRKPSERDHRPGALTGFDALLGAKDLERGLARDLRTRPQPHEDGEGHDCQDGGPELGRGKREARLEEIPHQAPGAAGGPPQ